MTLSRPSVAHQVPSVYQPVVEELEAERDRYRKALEEIARIYSEDDLAWALAQEALDND